MNDSLKRPLQPRPSVLSLNISSKSALYAAYMPAFTEGGLFVPTTRDYKLGEDIYLLLSLPDDPQRFPVAGKVAWLTPANASGGRTQGVGVRFPGDEKTRLIRVRIGDWTLDGLEPGTWRATTPPPALQTPRRPPAPPSGRRQPATGRAKVARPRKPV